MERTTYGTVCITDTKFKEKNEVTCGENSYDESTCYWSSDYDILNEHDEIITLNDIARVEFKKVIRQGKLI